MWNSLNRGTPRRCGNPQATIRSPGSGSAREPRSGSSAGNRAQESAHWNFSSLEGLTARAFVPNWNQSARRKPDRDGHRHEAASTAARPHGARLTTLAEPPSRSPRRYRDAMRNCVARCGLPKVVESQFDTSAAAALERNLAPLRNVGLHLEKTSSSVSRTRTRVLGVRACRCARRDLITLHQGPRRERALSPPLWSGLRTSHRYAGDVVSLSLRL
jgi:hypothetical protein